MLLSGRYTLIYFSIFIRFLSQLIVLCFTYRPPFNGINNGEILDAVRTGNFEFPPKYFKDISNEAKDFINICLNMNPRARPTADVLVLHPWFNKFKKGSHEPVGLEVVRRLNRFQKHSRLAKICLEVVAHTLPDEKVDDLRREFAKFDPLGIGEISLASFRTALEQNGSFSRSDIDYMFDGINFSKDKTIQYHEFIAAAVSQKQIDENEMKTAFEIMSNHSGKITLESLQDILGGEEIHLGSAAEIMREEQLSPSDKPFGFDEFCRVMRATGSPVPTKTKKQLVGNFFSPSRSSSCNSSFSDNKV